MRPVATISAGVTAMPLAGTMLANSSGNDGARVHERLARIEEDRAEPSRADDTGGLRRGRGARREVGPEPVDLALELFERALVVEEDVGDARALLERQLRRDPSAGRRPRLMPAVADDRSTCVSGVGRRPRRPRRTPCAVPVSISSGCRDTTTWSVSRSAGSPRRTAARPRGARSPRGRDAPPDRRTRCWRASPGRGRRRVRRRRRRTPRRPVERHRYRARRPRARETSASRTTAPRSSSMPRDGGLARPDPAGQSDEQHDLDEPSARPATRAALAPLQVLEDRLERDLSSTRGLLGRRLGGRFGLGGSASTARASGSALRLGFRRRLDHRLRSASSGASTTAASRPRRRRARPAPVPTPRPRRPRRGSPAGPRSSSVMSGPAVGLRLGLDLDLGWAAARRHLAHRQADAAARHVDVDHLDLDLLAHGQHRLRRVHVLVR